MVASLVFWFLQRRLPFYWETNILLAFLWPITLIVVLTNRFL